MILAFVYVIIYMTLYLAIRILYDEYKTYGWDSVEIEQQTVDYINKNFTFDEIYFFSEIGFEDEGGNTACIKKFESDTITYRVIGNPTESQTHFLIKMVDTLNKVLLYNKIIKVDKEITTANLTVFFTPKQKMIEHSHPMINGVPLGRFYTSKMDKCRLIKIDLYVTCDEISVKDSKAILLQEFTQSLGLFNDSERLKNTVFKDGYGLDSVYGPFDLACVKILYNSEIKPGVRLKTFEDALGISDERTLKEQIKSKKSIFEIN